MSVIVLLREQVKSYLGSSRSRSSRTQAKSGTVVEVHPRVGLIRVRVRVRVMVRVSG